MTEHDIRRGLVQANHILFKTGVVDAFGHVSLRSPSDPDRFHMARSIAPARVGVEDILKFDFDGNPLSEPGAKAYLERFIHGEIYRRHPSVQAVVHSHAASVLPFTVVETVSLRPVCHMCGFLGHHTRTFDVSTVVGDGSDMLIRSAEMGRALAEELGEQKVILMRSHGYTAVGHSLQEAVYNAVYTQTNAKMQFDALHLGQPRFLTEAEAGACEATMLGCVDRAWDLWVELHAPVC